MARPVEVETSYEDYLKDLLNQLSNNIAQIASQAESFVACSQDCDFYSERLSGQIQALQGASSYTRLLSEHIDGNPIIVRYFNYISMKTCMYPVEKATSLSQELASRDMRHSFEQLAHLYDQKPQRLSPLAREQFLYVTRVHELITTCNQWMNAIPIIAITTHTVESLDLSIDGAKHSTEI